MCVYSLSYSTRLCPLSPQAPLTPGVTTSKSQVPKTLKKDLKAIEERLARFRMDAVLPGSWEENEGGAGKGQQGD